MQLGIYPFSTGFTSSIAAFDAFNGKPSDYVLLYASGGADWTALLANWTAQIAAVAPSNKVIHAVIGLPDTGATMAQVGAGTFNSQLTTIINALIAAMPGASKYVITWFKEFNFPGSKWTSVGDEANYIAGSRVGMLLAKSISPKVENRWCPNITVNISGTDYNPMLAYPGDDVVDSWEIDGYYINAFDGVDPVAAWNSKLNSTYGYNWFANTADAHAKPKDAGEWGFDTDVAGPYIDRFKAYLLARGFRSHGYFNANSTWQNRIDQGQYPTAADTFINDFGILKVDGFAIGDAGSGIFAGFELAWGDDFNYRPSMWSGANTAGRYSSSPPHIGFRRVAAASSDVMIYIEPGYKGNRSQSPTPLGFDAVTAANSLLSITAQAIPGGLAAYLPTNYTQGGGDGSNKPQLISGGLRSWNSFMLSADGDFVFSAKVKLPGGQARGAWPSEWLTCVAGHWPDFGELDLFEGQKPGGSTSISLPAGIHVSNADGAGDVQSSLGSANGAAGIARVLWMVARKLGNTINFYDDGAAQGTLALVGTYTDAARVGTRLRGSWDVRTDFAVNLGWDSSTFNAGDWPKTTQWESHAIWIPIGSQRNAPMNVLTQINTTPGGPWTATVPSNASLFGGTSPDIIEVCGAYDNEDAPGMPTRNATTTLPSSMTVDMTARTISGTVPLTEGGKMGVLFMGSFAAGGASRRAIQYFNVAPAAQGTLFADIVANSGDVISKTVSFTDFHSGNLGPHTYVITKTAGGTDFTITGNGTGSASINGTATTSEVSSFSIACTNSRGQTTNVTRSITLAAAFSIATWTDAIEWWKADDNATVFSDSAATIPAVVDVDKVRAWVGKKLGAVLVNTVSTVTSPAYVTDSIKSKKTVKFNRANVTRLTTTNATILALASGNDVAHGILAAVRRGTPAVSVTPFNYTRLTTQTDIMRYLFSGGDAVGATRTVNNAGTNALSANTIATTDTHDIVFFQFTGTTLNVVRNGTLIGNAIALNTAAVTFTQFALGAIFSVALAAYDSSTAFDGAVDEFVLVNGGLSLADSNLAAASAQLATNWQ